MLVAPTGLTGCYQYTITEQDGSQRTISKKEYEQIKREAPNRSYNVPQDF